MALELMVYTSVCCIIRMRHIDGVAATRASIVLPQSSYMRQGSSDSCLHDVAGACSSGRRTHVRGFERVTETGESGGLARGLRPCLG